MKDILIITNYFPPEIGAASNRIQHLAKGLNNKGHNVHVITPMPNYPTGKIFKNYKGKVISKSIENNLNITRLWLFASNSKNSILRFFAMFSYSLSLAIYFLTHQIPNTVIIQSPPILVAFTSLLTLKSKKRTLILNVSDLWPIAGKELGVLKNGLLLKVFEKIEKFNYKNADIILGQSQEIITHINAIAPNKKTIVYRNYPDFKISDINYSKNQSEKITIVYAGLLGVAQGILKLLTSLDYSKIEIHIYGSGFETEAIKQYINKNPSLPITYHGQLDRKLLHETIKNYDITIIPLLKRIYGSVPSKIFEYARLGLPIVYFGGGEGEHIIKKHKLGWVAKAGDYSNLNTIINSIDKTTLTEDRKKEIQKKSINHFSFSKQLDKLISSILTFKKV